MTGCVVLPNKLQRGLEILRFLVVCKFLSVGWEMFLRGGGCKIFFLGGGGGAHPMLRSNKYKKVIDCTCKGLCSYMICNVNPENDSNEK